MNNYQLHDKAQELSDKYSAYALARMLIAAELALGVKHDAEERKETES